MQDTVSDEKSAKTNERRKVLRVMARSMFNESWDGKADGATSGARKEAYKAALPELRKRANKMRRYMSRNGLQITVAYDDE